MYYNRQPYKGDNMKLIKWLVKNMLLGLVMLYIINILGVYVDINIPINLATIFIAGTLRLPGLIALALLTSL